MRLLLSDVRTVSQRGSLWECKRGKKLGGEGTGVELEGKRCDLLS